MFRNFGLHVHCCSQTLRRDKATTYIVRTYYKVSWMNTLLATQYNTILLLHLDTAAIGTLGNISVN